MSQLKKEERSSSKMPLKKVSNEQVGLFTVIVKKESDF